MASPKERKSTQVLELLTGRQPLKHAVIEWARGLFTPEGNIVLPEYIDGPLLALTEKIKRLPRNPRQLQTAVFDPKDIVTDYSVGKHNTHLKGVIPGNPEITMQVTASQDRLFGYSNHRGIYFATQDMQYGVSLEVESGPQIGRWIKFGARSPKGEGTAQFLRREGRWVCMQRQIK